MTTNTPRRAGTAPAYYLGRTAAFWLETLAPRPVTRRHPPRRSTDWQVQDAGSTEPGADATGGL